MSVIVDTSVWSLALRRRLDKRDKPKQELIALIDEDRVVMLGVIRQELLSGVRSSQQFRTLRDRLRAFPDVEVDHIDYENAASCFNECRAKGVQGSNTDFLLCALALRRDLAIFTTGGDFPHYGRVLGIKLHEVRSEIG
ncbi:MAG: PIN domain-containing protein [Polyangiaceae bacterium]|nr:PIN domain-containing protein [Polyangiaceae bacterium]